MQTRTFGILSTAVAATLFVTGCSSSDHSGHSSRTHDTRDTYHTTRYDDRSYDQTYDRSYDHDRYGDRDATLSSGRTSGSGVVKEGRGEMFYTADRSGEIKVYDADADRMVYSGHLRRGERFALNPNGNRAEVNGHTVLEQDLKRDHRFEIRFNPD